MGVRAFRWLPHDGSRHAIPAALVPRDDGRTLCGVEVTVPHEPAPRSPDGCWPTCQACDVAWRKSEGIAVFPWPHGTEGTEPAVVRALPRLTLHCTTTPKAPAR
ncbi:zinc finger protein [Saccharothrix isguenensis]